MTPRYRADVELDGERHVPCVRDRRRKGHQAECYCISMFMAKRIAAALNAHQQRRLPLAKGEVMSTAEAATVLRKLVEDTRESREEMPETATFSNLRAMYLSEIEALNKALEALEETRERV